MYYKVTGYYLSSLTIVTDYKALHSSYLSTKKTTDPTIYCIM